MKVLKIMCITILMSLTPLVIADANSEAKKLLDIMNMEIMLQESIDLSLNAQIQANPAIAPLKDVMNEFLEKYMSYDSLEDDLIKIYAETFTEAELKEINAFYLTPTGKKVVHTMPQLMNKGGELGMQRVQENMAELESLIDTEVKRLEALESEAAE